MKKSSLLTLIVLLFPVIAAAQTPPAPEAPTKQAELHTWKKYAVKDEGISASFPTAPAVTTNYRTWTRNKNLRDRMVGAYADGVVYSIYTYETAEPRQTFQDFVNEQTLTGPWNRSSERTVKSGALTGKQYSSKNENLPGIAQLFDTKNRLYKITVMGVSADDPRLKEFFASITFDTKDGIEVSDGPGTPFSEPGCEMAVTGKEVDTKARLVMRPEPSYTDEARRAQTMGTVVLKVVFSCNGSVVNIRTAAALPNGLTEQAIAAARKLKFIPAVKDGKYASMWMQLEYNFNLY